MSKHTPGPWSVGPHPGNGAGDDWRTVLADTPEFGPLYIAEAVAPDARLIAAAPELLAALRDMVRFVGTDAGRVLSMIPEDTWYAAHHAIAKATD